MPNDVGFRLGIDGENEFKNALKAVESQIKNLNSEMKAAVTSLSGMDGAEGNAAKQAEILGRAMEATRGKIKLLTSEYDAQKKKLDELEKAMDDAYSKEYASAGERELAITQATNAYNRQAMEVNKLGKQIHDATSDMNRMEKEMRDIESGADKAGDALDDLGGEADKAGGRLKDIFTGSLLADGVKSLISGISNLASETMEYRKILGTLEVSGNKAGYSAKETAETYRQLYSIIGDEQQAATAAANLQALGLAQKDLVQLTDAAIGAWATYGDSIPIDSLAESINETIRVAQVTGTFADVLNWAGTSEDEFNLKLSQCSSEADRVNLVMQELSNQGLMQAADMWRENNAGIVQMNQSQDRLSKSLASLGEIVSPVVSTIRDGISDILEGFVNLATGSDALTREIEAQAESWSELQAASKEQAEANLANIDYAGELIEALQSLTDANGKVAESEQGNADALYNLINTLLPGYVTRTGEGTDATYEFADSIEEVIKQKKALAVLEAYEDDYTAAIKEQSAAQQELIDLYAQKAQLQEKAEESGMMGPAYQGKIQNQLNSVQEQIRANEELMISQQNLISNYEALQTAISSGDYEAAIANFEAFGISMKNVSAMTSEELKQQASQIQGAMAQIMNELSNPDISPENAAILTALLEKLQSQESEVLNQLEVLGIKMPSALGDGMRSGEPNATEAAKATKDNVVNALEFSSDASQKGTDGSGAYASGIDAQKGIAASAGMSVASSALNPIQRAISEFAAAGAKSSKDYTSGVDSEASNSNAAGEKLAAQAKTGANAESGAMNGIGRNYGSGMAAGISAMWQAVYNAAFSLGKASKKGAEDAGAVHSPSREMKKVGVFYGEGFIVGVVSKSLQAIRAGENMGLATIEGTADGINQGESKALKAVRKTSKSISSALEKEIEKANAEIAKMEAEEQEIRAKEELEQYKKSVEEKYKELEKAESSEKQKILDEIAELEADWNKEQAEKAREAEKEKAEARLEELEDFKEEYQNALEEIESSQKTMADKLKDYGDLFETVKTETGEFLKLEDLEKDISTIRRYGGALGELKQRGIPDTLMSEIVDMDVDDSIAYAEKLLSMTDEKYEEYMALWNQKQEEAEAIAKEFYSDEMDALQEEFIDEIPQELSGVKDEMRTIGVNGIQGMIDGMYSKTSALWEAASSIVAEAISAMQSAADINSPSEKTAALVGAPMGEGVAAGFIGAMKQSRSAIESALMAPVERISRNDIYNSAAGVVNGMSAASSPSGTQTIIIPVNLNGKQIAEVVYDPLKQVGKQRGY